MSLTTNEAMLEGITDVLHTFNRQWVEEGDAEILMAGVLELLYDFIHPGAMVVTTSVVMHEGDWVTVETYGLP